MRRWTPAVLAVLIGAGGIATLKLAEASPPPQQPPGRASDRPCFAILSMQAYLAGESLVRVVDGNGCIWLKPRGQADGR